METENIIKEKWDILFIKPKSIYVRMTYLSHKTTNFIFNFSV